MGKWQEEQGGPIAWLHPSVSHHHQERCLSPTIWEKKETVLKPNQRPTKIYKEDSLVCLPEACTIPSMTSSHCCLHLSQPSIRSHPFTLLWPVLTAGPRGTQRVWQKNITKTHPNDSGMPSIWVYHIKFMFGASYQVHTHSQWATLQDANEPHICGSPSQAGPH